MKLRAIKIDKRLIPEWNGNKNQSANEHVVIHFSRIPGTSERSNYKTFRMSQQGGIEIVYNDNLMCSAFISKIDNLQIGDLKIKTGSDLATAAHPLLSDLFTEIRNYIFPDDEDFTVGESQA